MKTITRIMMTIALLVVALTASAQGPVTTATINKKEHPPRGKCHQKDSKIRFNDLYGEVSIRCNFEDDDAYEYAELDTEIFEDDRIRTKEESGAILGLEDMSTYVIKPESTLIIHTEEEKMSKLELIIGTTIANFKTLWEGKTLEVEMAQCVCGIEGTIVVFEQKGKESNVWLMAGAVSVKSKKTGKVTKLQPGQRSITGKNGVVQVKSFNIEEGAKKFGIKMSDINNHYSKKTSTAPVKKTNILPSSSNNRYEVKCAVVKYKYTEGKVTGQHERAFDNYGKLERRHEKTSKLETYLYIRDNKNYNLNVKKKTMTVKADNQLNFRNPNESRIKKTDKRKTATILGKTCTLYQTSSSDYWVWKGIVLKKVDHKKDGTQAIIEATSIQTPASLPASTFEVPKGYKTK